MPATLGKAREVITSTLLSDELDETISTHSGAGKVAIAPNASGKVLEIATAQARPLTTASDSWRQFRFAIGALNSSAMLIGSPIDLK
jgi:hypothetical protein